MIFDPFQPDLVAWVAHYGVVLLRIAGLFLFLPIFGSNMVPIKLRFGIASVLALAFMPLAPQIGIPPGEPVGWVLVGIRELSVGLFLGLSARMMFAGIEAAAGLLAGQSGFALASMVDPMSGDQALAPALFQNLIAIALFLAADLHHLFIRAIVGSWELVPPGAALPFLGSMDQVTTLFGMRLFTVAIELAAPAMIVTVAVDLVMALVGRAMPQIPILLIGYPFKMASGLVAMSILVTSTGAALGWIGRTLATDGATVIAAIAGR